MKWLIVTDRKYDYFGTAMKVTIMDDTTFMEAWSCYMGTASPICSNWIKRRYKPIRGKVRSIDVYGDNIARSHVCGDGWRTRHDSFKWSVVDVAD